MNRGELFAQTCSGIAVFAAMAATFFALKTQREMRSAIWLRLRLGQASNLDELRAELLRQNRNERNHFIAGVVLGNLAMYISIVLAEWLR